MDRQQLRLACLDRALTLAPHAEKWTDTTLIEVARAFEAYITAPVEAPDSES